MTAQEYMADATVRAAALLTHFIDTTLPEKQDWTPSVEGADGLRSMMDMADECIAVNHMIASILKGNAPPASSPMSEQRRFTSWDEGKLQLAESAQSLADVIRSLSSEALESVFLTRRGEMPGFLVIELPMRNMHYHVGQINLLQLLYGDTTYHFPAPKK